MIGFFLFNYRKMFLSTACFQLRFSITLSISYSTQMVEVVTRVQKTAPLNFCTPPDLHSASYKSNLEGRD